MILTNKEQQNKLNGRVKLRLAQSPIHGVGVFALRDIVKGEKIYADNMPEVYTLPHSQFRALHKEIRDLLIERWPQILDGSAFIYPDARMLAYMNHSSTPNYDPKTDTALENIKKGEEVTEDYRLIPTHAKAFPWLDKK